MERNEQVSSNFLRQRPQHVKQPPLMFMNSVKFMDEYKRKSYDVEEHYLGLNSAQKPMSAKTDKREINQSDVVSSF
jgi:hypothetical protein